MGCKPMPQNTSQVRLGCVDRIIDNAGAKLWSTVTGTGPVNVILCNGGPGCDDYLGPVATLIEDRCRVVRFEPRGCGRSTRDGRYDLHTQLDDLDAVRRAYAMDRPILCGHSAGVDTILAYALRWPDRVRGLIGISGGRIVNDREWSRVYKENLARIGEDHGGKVFDADPRVNEIGNASWREFITAPTLLRDLARLDVPATFLFGTADIRPSWPTRQLAALLPRGEYVEIAGAAHSIWLTHADGLRVALIAVIERVGA